LQKKASADREASQEQLQKLMSEQKKIAEDLQKANEALAKRRDHAARVYYARLKQKHTRKDAEEIAKRIAENHR